MLQSSSAHQPNYHTSIWHVAIHGINDPDIVERVRRAHEEVIPSCLAVVGVCSNVILVSRGGCSPSSLEALASTTFAHTV